MQTDNIYLPVYPPEKIALVEHISQYPNPKRKYKRRGVSSYWKRDNMQLRYHAKHHTNHKIIPSLDQHLSQHIHNHQLAPILTPISNPSQIPTMTTIPTLSLTLLHIRGIQTKICKIRSNTHKNIFTIGNCIILHYSIRFAASKTPSQQIWYNCTYL